MPVTDRLMGRERELEAIVRLIDQLPARGGALLVSGEPGVGKTALVHAGVQAATARGMRVLRATGVPSETPMPYAGLHQILRPLLPAIGGLPQPQRAALSAAFGLSDMTAPDLYLIALGTLELLADAGAAAPILVVAEDAHWLDPATVDVLTFVARRVEVEPILMLFAIREGHDVRLRATAIPELRLEGIGEAAAEQLLDVHAPRLAPEARRRLLDTAEGNPLALIELASAFGDERETTLLLAPLPLTERLAQAFSARFAGLPQGARDLLLVAALDEGGTLHAQLHAGSVLAKRPLGRADLSPAESAGLVAVDGGIRFRHPLMRAAAHGLAPAIARREAHASLAVAYQGDFERGAWHRAAAADGPDAAAAVELQAVARQAVARGAPEVAALALERAAELTADGGGRGGLLARAAEIHFEIGRPAAALQLLGDAKRLPLAPDDRARLSYLVEVTDDEGWSSPMRVAAFVETVVGMTKLADPALVSRALLAAAVSCWWGNPLQATRDRIVATAESLPLPDDHPVLLGILACADPVQRGAVVIERIRAITPDAVTDPAEAHLLGRAAAAVWAFDLSLGFFARAVDGLRTQARLGLLAQALVSQAWAAVHLGKGTLAAGAADEAGRLSRETGQLRWATAADLVAATLAGERGDFETAELLARSAESQLLPMGAHGMLALVQFARGRQAVAHQRYAEGFDHLVRVVDPSDVAFHPFVGAWSLSDLVESAVLTDRTDEGREFLRRLEDLASRTSAPFLHAGLAYARPFLASDEEAEPLYLAALAAGLADWPCYRGRLLLNYGRWLRRQRRVAESREPLRAAREIFDALAFVALAESARQELRASGETSTRRDSNATEYLTPQELQIAELAALGLSNREIGRRMYLSPRTVESHLYRIFPKLGIKSRAQLVRALPPQSLAGPVFGVGESSVGLGTGSISRP